MEEIEILLMAGLGQNHRTNHISAYGLGLMCFAPIHIWPTSLASCIHNRIRFMLVERLQYGFFIINTRIRSNGFRPGFQHSSANKALAPKYEDFHKQSCLSRPSED